MTHELDFKKRKVTPFFFFGQEGGRARGKSRLRDAPWTPTTSGYQSPAEARTWARAHQTGYTHRLITPNRETHVTEVSVTHQSFQSELIASPCTANTYPALLLNKYLGEILRAEGRLLAALGEAAREGGPRLLGLCLGELAGTA